MAGKLEIGLAVRAPSVDKLIFGGAPIANLYKEISDEDAKGALDKAVEVGITYFDTAPFYGGGLSEMRFGKWLPKDKNLKISTKCGRYIMKKQDYEKVKDTKNFEDL